MEKRNKDSQKKGIRQGVLFGVAFLIFGIITIIVPEGPLSLLIIGIALLLVVNGTITGVTNYQNRKTNIHWKKASLLGIIQFILGLILLIRPVEISNNAITVLFAIIGIFFLLSGIGMFIYSLKSRLEIVNFGAFVTRSILMFIIGFILLLEPLGFGYLMMRLIGFSSLAFGVMQIILSLKLFSKGAGGE